MPLFGKKLILIKKKISDWRSFFVHSNEFTLEAKFLFFKQNFKNLLKRKARKQICGFDCTPH